LDLENPKFNRKEKKTCGDIDILKRWLEVLRPFSLE
jgi:hypothetical protein